MTSTFSEFTRVTNFPEEFSWAICEQKLKTRCGKTVKFPKGVNRIACPGCGTVHNTMLLGADYSFHLRLMKRSKEVLLTIEHPFKAASVCELFAEDLEDQETQPKSIVLGFYRDDGKSWGFHPEMHALRWLPLELIQKKICTDLIFLHEVEPGSTTNK